MAEVGAAPVVAIDGPAASGKGTLTRLLSLHLDWRLLDSGAIYRSLALMGRDAGLDAEDIGGHTALSGQLAPKFVVDEQKVQVRLQGRDRTAEIRSRDISARSAALAAHMEIRDSILEIQRSYRRFPGLVADGRDMATRVFPDATLSIYLEAAPETRAERRALELQQRGQSVSIRTLTEELRQRDQLDRERKASPLRIASGGHCLDTTGLSPSEVFEIAMGWVRKALPAAGRDSGE